MKQYALLTGILGSDQLVRLDGRWNRFSTRKACIEHARRVKRHHADFLLKAEVYGGSCIREGRLRYTLHWTKEELMTHQGSV